MDKMAVARGTFGTGADRAPPKGGLLPNRIKSFNGLRSKQTGPQNWEAMGEGLG